MNARPAASSQQPRRAPVGGADTGTFASAAAGTPSEPAGVPLSQSLRPRGPVELRVSHYSRPEATVVTVAGELDILTAPKFSATINELARQPVGDIVVDLTEVRFVDSAGLQVLLSAQRRVVRRARWLGVICPSGPVRRVIELARLTDVLGLVASLSECDAELGAGE